MPLQNGEGPGGGGGGAAAGSNGPGHGGSGRALVAYVVPLPNEGVSYGDQSWPYVVMGVLVGRMFIGVVLKGVVS